MYVIIFSPSINDFERLQKRLESLQKVLLFQLMHEYSSKHFPCVEINFHAFQIITNHSGEHVDLAKIYAPDDRTMAFRILQQLLPDLRGKIVEPQKKLEPSRVIADDVIVELKRKRIIKIL